MKITKIGSRYETKCLFNRFGILVNYKYKSVDGPILIEFNRWNVLIYDNNTEVYKKLVPNLQIGKWSIHWFDTYQCSWSERDYQGVVKPNPYSEEWYKNGSS